MIRRVARAGLPGLLACASACSFGPSAEEKAEAGTLNRAIDVLRRAPNADKASLLAVLDATACERPALCALKKSCSAAYALHVQGVAHEAEAKAALASSAPADKVTALLAAASDELLRAKPLVEKCTDEQGELQRRYKL